MIKIFLNFDHLNSHTALLRTFPILYSLQHSHSFPCLCYVYSGFGGSLVPFLWPIILLRAKDFMVDRHLKSDDDKVFFRETLKSSIGFSSILA